MNSKSCCVMMFAALTLWAGATLPANAALDLPSSNFTPVVKPASVVFGSVELPPIPESFLSNVPSNVRPQILSVAIPEPGTLAAGLGLLGYSLIGIARRRRRA